MNGVLVSSAIILVLNTGVLMSKQFIDDIQPVDVNALAFAPEETDWSSVQNMVKNHEGKRLDVYADTKGLATVGYGHLVNPGDSLAIGDRITQEHADSLFTVDWDHHYDSARGLLDDGVFDSMPHNQQAALIDLTYNMGPGKLKSEFPSMLKGFNTGDYQSAADNLQWVDPSDQSKGRSGYWTDVGDRSSRIHNLILGNTSVDEINAGY